jgi:hypothetical protein
MSVYSFLFENLCSILIHGYFSRCDISIPWSPSPSFQFYINEIEPVRTDGEYYLYNNPTVAYDARHRCNLILQSSSSKKLVRSSSSGRAFSFALRWGYPPASPSQPAFGRRGGKTCLTSERLHCRFCRYVPCRCPNPEKPEPGLPRRH